MSENKSESLCKPPAVIPLLFLSCWCAIHAVLVWCLLRGSHPTVSERYMCMLDGIKSLANLYRWWVRYIVILGIAFLLVSKLQHGIHDLGHTRVGLILGLAWTVA